MAIPSSGPLTLSDIQTEFGGTNPISLSEYYAGGGLVPTGTTGTYGAVPSSGEISIQKFYGTSNVFTFNLTSGSNLNLRTEAIAAGWGGTSPVVATIPSGNTIQSSSTGSYALTINGSFPAGVTLINNGTILGRGGDGGAGGAAFMDSTNQTAGTASAGSNGGSGGPALLVSSTVSINNIGSINGGGGGGGGGGGAAAGSKGGAYTSGGGGGGGGIGVSTGGTGGVGSGTNLVKTTGNVGGNGSTTTFGLGGVGNIAGSNPNADGGDGGAGGTFGSAGSAGATGTTLSAVSPKTGAGGALGAAGACLSGNANITWIAFGTRNGAIT